MAMVLHLDGYLNKIGLIEFFLFLQNLFNSFLKFLLFGEPGVSVGNMFVQYFGVFLLSLNSDKGNLSQKTVTKEEEKFQERQFGICSS